MSDPNLILPIWITALRKLLGWRKEKTIAWAKRWESGLSGKDPGFHHETIIWYIDLG
jgi:hypothetical protein